MVSKRTVVAPLGVATQELKKYKIAVGRKIYSKELGERVYHEPIYGFYQPTMFLYKRPNKTQPLQYMLCTHIRKGKDYPYNSEKRGWASNTQ